MTPDIYPCLWFNGTAKAAAEFYCSVFKESTITSENPVAVIFNLAGEKFMALNGGPKYQVNPSASFFVICETEAETDEVWVSLIREGKILMPLDKYPWSDKYGWVEDKFGVSWQIAFGKMEEVGQKFTPCLMFTGKYHGLAEHALKFYTEIFKESSLAG